MYNEYSRQFNLFWKTLNISKDTIEEVSKEIDREIAHLSINKIPYLKGRALSKALEHIQMLKERREELKRKFGRGTKAPMPDGKEYPTITPVNVDPSLNREGQN